MKKLTLILMAIAIITSYTVRAQTAINTDGTDPDGSAMLDVKSEDSGFLPPRMTTTQRDAIISPADGLVIFNTSTNCLNFYAAGHWIEICGSADIPTAYNPATGETWMDRNLGASQVATSSTDALAYGDLYQWGRLKDGHESRTSGTTTDLSSTDDPGHGDFILSTISPYDWRSPQNDNLWQSLSGINNPCPNGFRLPTEAELWAERNSWLTANAAGAYASPLKFTLAGFRDRIDGLVKNVDTDGYYWSSTVSTIDGIKVHILYISSSQASKWDFTRAPGVSVRCIKD